MKNSIVTGLVFGWLVLGSAQAVDFGKMTAKEILDRVDDLYRGKSAQGQMTMQVVTEHWSREMKLEFWTKGKEKSMFRILSPRKEKGTATLKAGNNIWNYLPKVKRVIKVPSSMMGGSWMGSHFTNDDLVKESRMADDFEFMISFEGKRKDIEVIEITCTPKPNAAVVWGQVVVQVRRKDLLPVWMKYFDEDLEPARTMTFSEYKKFDDRVLPSRARIVPTDKPNEYTQVTYDQVKFNQQLKDSLFSLRNLQR